MLDGDDSRDSKGKNNSWSKNAHGIGQINDQIEADQIKNGGNGLEQNFSGNIIEGDQ